MRRWLAPVLALLVPVTCPAAEVAVLKSSETPAWRPAIEALKRGAAAHTLTEYDLKGDRAEALRVLAELKPRSPLVVALGPLAAQVAREAAPELPLIFCMIQDPAQLGLLNVPNVSGVAFSIPIMNQLAAFRTVNPRGVRVGVIYGSEPVAKLVAEAQSRARVLRLNIVERRVASDKEVPEALRGLLKGSEAVDALWLPPDPLLLGDEARRFILAETLKAGKPVYAFAPALVAEGALVSNSPDLVSVGDQAAELVGRMLSGDRTAALMVPRGELVINKKSAERLKLEIPADALAQAKTY